MPSPSRKKTKSAPETTGLRPDTTQTGGSSVLLKKHRQTIFLAVGIILALFLILSPSLFYRPPTAELRVGNQTRQLEIAASESAQSRGLGYRDSLAEDRGMLFVFKQPKAECFWMKGMRFPLDIIWLDANKRVIFIKANAQPDSYPAEFCPPSAASSVIELNADQAKQLGIFAGNTVQL